MLEVRCGEASPLQGAETPFAEKTAEHWAAGKAEKKRKEFNVL